MRELIGLFLLIATAFCAGAALWCGIFAKAVSKEGLFSGIKNAAVTYLGSSFAGWGFAVISVWAVIQLQKMLY